MLPNCRKYESIRPIQARRRGQRLALFQKWQSMFYPVLHNPRQIVFSFRRLDFPPWRHSRILWESKSQPFIIICLILATASLFASSHRLPPLRINLSAQTSPRRVCPRSAKATAGGGTSVREVVFHSTIVLDWLDPVRTPDGAGHLGDKIERSLTRVMRE
jgi:hypothetical protein